MNFSSVLLVAFIVIKLTPLGFAGVRRNSRKLSKKSTEVTTGPPSHVTKTRFVTSQQDGEVKSEPRQTGQVKGKQDLIVLPGEKSLKNPKSNNPLKGYGMFNSDTHSCSGILQRPCNKPSDCDGCLGLFTCHLPRGKCNVKSVSRREAQFYDSLQKHAEDNEEMS